MLTAFTMLAIMAPKRTGKSANGVPRLSLLPQTDTHPSEPPYPARNVRAALKASPAWPKGTEP